MMDPGEKLCPYCAEAIKADAAKCRYCSEFVDEQVKQEEDRAVMHSPFNRGLAAAMSVVVPGLGHIFQGKLALGFTAMALMFIFMLVGTLFTFIGFFIAACIYVAVIYDAYAFETAPVAQPTETQPLAAADRSPIPQR